MSNFNKIYFDLLIIMVTMSQYSLGQILLAPMTEISEVTDAPGPISYTSSLFQYDDQDRFYFYDPDDEPTILSSKLKEEFSSDAIEFCSYHDCRLEFFYRRSEGEVIRLRCYFPNEGLVWRFYDSIYDYQERGAVSYIFKMAQYVNDTEKLNPFARQVILYAKDVGEFTGGAVAKTYSISRFSQTSERTEPYLIFHSKAFAISEIYKNDKVALCLGDYPYVRFLIAFSGQRDGKRFIRDHMQANMQREGLTCEFPLITPEDELLFLDE